MLSSLNIPLLQRAPNVKVLVRGWLNCNQIAINQPAENIVIDAGYYSHAPATIAQLRTPEVSEGKKYSRLINTHCHSDHMGGNAAIQRAFGCTIEVPVGEAAGVRPWSRQSFWLDYADQHAEPFDYDKTIAPNEILLMGGYEWRAIAAPGHDMGALMFYCAELKLLISGDALWNNGLGAIAPKQGVNPSVEAALATLQSIRELNVDVVIPGHGRPFVDVDEALTRAESRLRAYQAEPRKCARNFLKSIFTFHLLEVGCMRVDDVANYFARVPCYVDINAEFFQLKPPALADLLVSELLSVHAIKIQQRKVYPLMAV
ncbi:MAG: Hydroxyacylglutathione hydrolase [Pseudomonadota bacterium]|jgi:glyoxylase-like metal-dependent hydrolase (beta-lactamase superfamily II)